MVPVLCRYHAHNKSVQSVDVGSCFSRCLLELDVAFPSLFKPQPLAWLKLFLPRAALRLKLVFNFTLQPLLFFLPFLILPLKKKKRRNWLFSQFIIVLTLEDLFVSNNKSLGEKKTEWENLKYFKTWQGRLVFRRFVIDRSSEPKLLIFFYW